jgi:hypothetical protein
MPSKSFDKIDRLRYGFPVRTTPSGRSGLDGRPERAQFLKGGFRGISSRTRSGDNQFAGAHS